MSRLRSDAGFTLIEVIVAAAIAVIVIGASALLFVAGNNGSLSSQRQSELIAVADQQIENIRQLVKTKGFDALAMSGQPAALPSSISNVAYSSTSPVDPNSFVATATGCGGSGGKELLIEANYDNTSEGVPVNPQGSGTQGLLPWSNCTSSSAQVGEPLEIISGGFVTPQQNNVAVGSDTATVDTYVTDTYVGCNSGGFGGCPSTSGGVVGCNSSSTWPTSTTTSTTCADARRVTVAVVMNDHGRNDIGPNTPVYISTVFANPSPSNEPTTSIGLTLGLNIG
jgi:prepilin-type N-terminal cleavage/methylation domain-containing protein